MKRVPVSVILPCYKCKSTIGRALSSIKEQSLLPAEIIIVDDCSPDDTFEYIQNLSNEYPNGWIKTISMSSNKGPGAARNMGWDLATQSFVAFIDADDAWHPDKLQIQYRLMADHPHVSISGHPCSIGMPENLFRYRTGDGQFRTVNRHKMLIKNLFQTPSVMLKRGLPFRFETKKYAEDYLLWLELLFAGYSGAIVDIPLAYTFKADFGEKGLSADLWQMEMGQLDCFIKLYQKKRISFAILIVAASFSLGKYFRRLLITRFRQNQ